MAKELIRWGDSQQYVSEPATSNAPTVKLINATRDPLGSIAALTAMYSGRVVRSLREVTDEERQKAFEDMTKTELSGALEAVQFQFLLENVTRAFTHQLVRTRAAFFAQESLRFAVVEDWTDRVPLPPSIRPGSEAETKWDCAIENIAQAYHNLVNNGVPAEDARALLPHGITTRVMVVMNLRTLLHQAGLRLCTQAQFEWRVVYAGIVKALRSPSVEAIQGNEWGKLRATGDFLYNVAHFSDLWQFNLIADHLRPVCYQQGKCGFMASMDRNCKIRERVEANSAAGIAPDSWGDIENPHRIQTAEWAADPSAARA